MQSWVGRWRRSWKVGRGWKRLAQYGKTGVNTIVMGSDGVVYQRDLGPATASRAKALRTLTPDDGWGRVPEH